MKTTRKLHNEDEVIRSLSKKSDIRIDSESKIIKVLSKLDKDGNPNKEAKNDLGNGSWGKIDFLRNYCGYYLMKVFTLKNQR